MKGRESEGITIMKKNSPDLGGATKFAKFFNKEKSEMKKRQIRLDSIPRNYLKDGGLLNVKSQSSLPPIFNLDESKTTIQLIQAVDNHFQYKQ
jgi:hypothetical protein